MPEIETSPPDFAIRPAAAADLAAILAIEREQFANPWPLHQFERELELPCSRFQVIETPDGAEIAGFSIAWVIPPTAEVHNIAVARKYQGRGWGRKLLNHLLESLGRDVAEVYLEVRPSNRRAISLYETAGFSCVGRRKNYYDNPVEDAWVYHLPLDQK